jgi:hypothetical protein
MKIRKTKMLRPKKICEICGFAKKNILHRHHIIPKQDSRSTNSDNNLAVVCPTCHSLIHSGYFIVIGMYQSTNGKQLVWFKNGEKPPMAKEFWLVKENPLVRTLKGEEDDLPD